MSDTKGKNNEYLTSGAVDGDGHQSYRGQQELSVVSR